MRRAMRSSAVIISMIGLVLAMAMAQPTRAAAVTQTAGGYQIHSSRGSDGTYERCTLGFNVRRQNQYFFITAGHCAVNNHYRWYRSDGSYLGTTSRVAITHSYDYALISYTSSVPITKYGSVYIGAGHYADITTVATTDDVSLLMPVCFTGSTTGHHCGKITDRCKFRAQPGPDIYCALETDICVQPGDSGGPLYSGSMALGVLRAGWQDSRCHSLFTPLLPILVEAGQVGVY